MGWLSAGVDVDADLLMEQITDEVIHHGDVEAALRRIMERGFRPLMVARCRVSRS